MVKTIKQWLTLTLAIEVRSFHGLANFYHKFVRDFMSIAAPLNELVKTNVKFAWTKKQENVFTLLKDKLCSTPILSLPDFNKTFELECATSCIGIGVVLMQEGCPIAYFS